MIFRCPGCLQDMSSFVRINMYPTPLDTTIVGRCLNCNREVEAIVIGPTTSPDQVIRGRFDTWVSKWIRDFHKETIRRCSNQEIVFPDDMPHRAR